MLSRFLLLLLVALFAVAVFASEATTDEEAIALTETAINCADDEVHFGPTCTNKCPSGTHGLFGKHCIYNVQRFTRTPSVPSNCAPEKIALFFSDKVYEVSDENIMKDIPATRHELLNNCGTWKIVNEFHMEKTLSLINIHALVAINQQNGIAVVAFRGTESGLSRLTQTTVNWLSNMAISKNPYPYAPSCGEVHSGFLKNFQTIEEQLTEQIRRLLEGKYHIIFTGHSYGGALSNLAGLRYAHAFPQYKPAMRVISIAAARVGNQDFANCFARNMNVADKKDGNTVLHYITKVPQGSEDIVTNTPPQKIGFVDTPGKKQWVPCLEEFTRWSVDAANCHIREAYIKGMLTGRVSNHPLEDDIEALSDEIAEQILADLGLPTSN